MAAAAEEAGNHEAMRQVIVDTFKRHDRHQQGTISRHQLANALARLMQPPLEAAHLDQLIDRVTAGKPGGGGEVPYEEFVSMIFREAAEAEKQKQTAAGGKNAQKAAHLLEAAAVSKSPAPSQHAGSELVRGKAEEYVGHNFRAVSVHYWSTQLMEEARQCGLDDRARVYEIEPVIIRPKGKDVVCPRDGRLGAAYVDCVSGTDNVGLAVVMLSYTWGYAIGDIASGLQEYCNNRGLDHKRIYVWICCLCINQHRVKEAQDRKESIPFEEFRQAFAARVAGVGRVVALMSPWKDPHYIKRVWCDFELYTCMQHADSDCQVAVTMPKAQKASMIEDLCSGHGFDEMWRALCEVRIEKAEATYPQDREMIMDIIQNSVDFHAVNMTVSKYLQSWIVKTCENFLEDRLASGKCCLTERVVLRLNVGSLLRQIGRDDMLDRGAEYLKQAKQELESIEGAQGSTCTNGVLNHGKLLYELGCALTHSGEWQQAELSFEQARKVFESSNNLHTVEGVSLLMEMGDYYRKCGQVEQSIRVLEEAWDIGNSLGDKAPPLLRANVLRRIGDAKRRNEDNFGALADYHEVRKIYEQEGTDFQPMGADLLNSIGMVLLDLNKKEETKKLLQAKHPDECDPMQAYKTARRIREMSSTLESHLGAKLLTSIGIIHCERKEKEDALQTLEQAREIFEQTGSLDTFIGARCMWALGDALALNESWQTAWNAYEKSRLIYEMRGSEPKAQLKENLEKANQNRKSELHRSVSRVRSENMEAPEGGLTVTTWNMASVNTNPFEYWITHSDEKYFALMDEFEGFLKDPGDRDVRLHEIFPDSFFCELLDLMRNEAKLDEAWEGTEFVEQEWYTNYRDRKIVKEFVMDNTISKKRLFAMPDLQTTRIDVVGQPKPSYRPSVINHYSGNLRSRDEWWLRWRNFMFHEALNLKGGDMKRPVELLQPLNDEKFKALSKEEAKASVPLQLLCLALYDCVLVHIMNHLMPDAHWQDIKRRVTDSMAEHKLSRTLSILRTTYSQADVICMQKVSTIYQRALISALGIEFLIIFPQGTNFEDPTATASVILLRRKFFDVSKDVSKPQDAYQDLTAEVLQLAACDKKPIDDGELLVISAKDASGRPWLIASFHSDGNGEQTKPVVTAMAEMLKRQPAPCQLIIGIDANTVLKPVKKELGVSDFVRHCESVGLRTCSGPQMEDWCTTCKARTFLQPQMQKAVGKDKKLSADVNPRDHIVIQRSAFSVKSLHKDNTGDFLYKEEQNIPSLGFPSDHGVLSAVLAPKDSDEP